MATTAPTSVGAWTRTHRAAVAIVLLTAALAAVLTLLLLRLTAGPAVAPAGAVPSTPQTVVDNCRTTPPGHDC